MRQVPAIVFASSVLAVFGTSSSSCRDQNSWPFSNASVWNTPLGSGAKFTPANLFPANLGPAFKMQSDDDYFIVTSEADPIVPWYNQGHWGGPNTPAAYCTITGREVRPLHFPASVNITTFGNNNAAAILLPDNDTLQLMQPLYVCGGGSPVLALEFSPSQNSTSIRGPGTLGGHGGSGLNAIGGTIRLGELLPAAAPIAHALKLEFFAHLYYFRPPSGNRSACFRWPAVQCDGYCFDCAASPGECYNGTDPLLTPGALLAVPPAAAAALNATLRTAPGRRVLAALATYGGYLVDDTAWNATSICTEHGVQAEFAAAYGFPFEVDAGSRGPAGAWYADLVDVVRALAVVVNNGPETPGGGGVPLAPPPPPFC